MYVISCCKNRNWASISFIKRWKCHSFFKLTSNIESTMDFLFCIFWLLIAAQLSFAEDNNCSANTFKNDPTLFSVWMRKSFSKIKSTHFHFDRNFRDISTTCTQLSRMPTTNWPNSIEKEMIVFMVEQQQSKWRVTKWIFYSLHFHSL